MKFSTDFLLSFQDQDQAKNAFVLVTQFFLPPDKDELNDENINTLSRIHFFALKEIADYFEEDFPYILSSNYNLMRNLQIAVLVRHLISALDSYYYLMVCEEDEKAHNIENIKKNLHVICDFLKIDPKSL